LSAAHDNLVWDEAEKLRKRGFFVDFEVIMPSGLRVDIFAERNNEVIIVECGHCFGRMTRLCHLKNYATKVVQQPYLLQWCFDKLGIEWEEKWLEEVLKPLDYRELLKPEFRAKLESPRHSK